MRKAQVWISAVLYIMIVVAVIVLILNVGTPILEKMKDKAIFSQTRNTLLNLDQHITTVKDEGQGSQRVVPIELRDGEFYIEDGTVGWELETQAEILEPRSSVDYGNLKIASNSDVSTIETNSFYILENGKISVNISKCSNLCSADNLINSILFKETKSVLDGNFSFSVNGIPLIINYTELSPAGNNTLMGSATVVAHLINQTKDLWLTLEGQADFIKTSLE